MGFSVTSSASRVASLMSSAEASTLSTRPKCRQVTTSVRRQLGAGSTVTCSADPTVPCRLCRFAPTAERPTPSKIASSPPIDRLGEVGVPAQLVSSLLAHAEELGDVDQAKQPPSGHFLVVSPVRVPSTRA